MNNYVIVSCLIYLLLGVFWTGSSTLNKLLKFAFYLFAALGLYYVIANRLLG